MGMIVPLSDDTHDLSDMTDEQRAMFTRGSLNPKSVEEIAAMSETEALVRKILPKDDMTTDEEYANIIRNCVQSVANQLEDSFAATPVNNVIG